jgi:Ca-activated chloride channel family protein
MGGGAAMAPAQVQLGKPAQLARAQGRDKEPAQAIEAKVRQIGTKTFYFKDGRWVDSSVKPEEDAKAEKVVQFTDSYFRLAGTQKAEYNQYFSQEEPVTVKLEGKVYHIDPAPKDAAP